MKSILMIALFAGGFHFANAQDTKPNEKVLHINYQKRAELKDEDLREKCIFAGYQDHSRVQVTVENGKATALLTCRRPFGEVGDENSEESAIPDQSGPASDYELGEISR